MGHRRRHQNINQHPLSVKVVFCTDGIFPHAVGGMQRHSRLLIEALATHHEVELVVMHPHEENVFDAALGIEEVKLKGIDENNNYLKECKAYSQRIYEALQQYPEHLIYSQGLSVWYKADAFTSRLIVNPHGLEPFQAMGIKDKLIALPFKKVFRKIFSQSAAVVALGGYLTDILNAEVRNAEVVVLPNAVNLPEGVVMKQKPDANEPLKLLFVSRFASNKGIHILIEAIRQLNEEGYDQLQYHLGGKGPLFEHYTTNHQYNNVHYLGFVSDEQLKELYTTSDAFVFPTLFEGMPTVVLEAMSHYLPIIVSDTGATSELVDKQNGYLIDSNNIGQLKEAIKALVALPAMEKNKLSEQSYQRVAERFTWQKVAERHMALFERMAQ